MDLFAYYWQKTFRMDFTEKELIEILSQFMVLSSFITFVAMTLCRLRASYGRYSSESSLKDYAISSRLAWFLQELPSFVIPLIAIWQVRLSVSWPNLAVVALFVGHYFHRTFIYAYLIKGGKSTPMHLFLLGVLFTSWNGYIQGFYHTKIATYPISHLYSFRAIIGFIIYGYGMFINIQADSILRNARRPGEIGYKIPRGGAFEYVSGANFFGEIVEWFGYAFFANTLTAWAFCLFTMANTIPRALEHHRWYHQKFKTYPKERKAVIPFLL